jgi:hypothetical protein
MPVFRVSRVVASAVAVMIASGATAGEADVRYNRDVRPILSDNCFQCHGPDQAQRKARLRLDVRESAIERGAIVPGDAEASELVKRVFASDAEEIMPPPDTHKTLTPAQKETLRAWVASGAKYEAHWAYLPIERPPVPTVDDAVGRSGVNPIDAFVRARLKEEGLEPAPEADRRTLLRRLSLDLIGLPPTPEEVDAFLWDASPDAYARQVERLLASPHFGERMAVPWLDAVRFADTVGYHGDQNQRIFPYRDYVIEAFNANKPFDVFTIEQLAGDLLPDPTIEQRVATGFNRLNMMTREGGAQPKEYLAKYQADRVRTVSTAWLGSTMACAECHDHKFDPFTTRDFYSMAAFFADVQQWGVYNDYSYTPNPDLKGWSNDHPFPPEVETTSPYLQRRIARLKKEIEAAGAEAGRRMASSAALREAFEGWRAQTRRFLREHRDGWAVAEVVAGAIRDGGRKDGAADAEVLEDGSIRWSAAKPGDARLVTQPPAGWVSSLRLELLPNADGTVLRGGASSGFVRLSAAVRRAGSTNEEAVSWVWAEATKAEPRYSNGHEILGVLGGWRTPGNSDGTPLWAVWELERPLRFAAGDALIVRLPNNPATRARLSVSPFAGLLDGWAERMEELAGESEDAEAEDGVSRWALAYYRSAGTDAEALAAFRRLESEIRECRGGRAWSLTTVSVEPMVTRVLPRGNWMDESGPVVLPATPSFLPAPVVSDGEGKRATRLDLARWLASPENPLTARNFVNRLWAQFFGAGISARIEDLGLQGEWPTHPELLDWLAAEFMSPSVEVGGIRAQHAWDVKHLARLIVMSGTYRQSCDGSERAREVDPQNRLWARQSPRRLDAEFVRDNALAIAGLVNLEVGGPSAFPYQPPDYYANLQFPDRVYRADRDERQYRRGVYTHWQRTFLHPMMANFDAQSREECVAARLISNTPQQALTLLNDPTFVEASRALATLALEVAGTDEERIRVMFRRALLRSPSARELGSLMALADRLRETYRSAPEDAERHLKVGLLKASTSVPPVELAAWSNVARVVLNLHETLTRY